MVYLTELYLNGVFVSKFVSFILSYDYRIKEDVVTEISHYQWSLLTDEEILESHSNKIWGAPVFSFAPMGTLPLSSKVSSGILSTPAATFLCDCNLWEIISALTSVIVPRKKCRCRKGQVPA